LSNSLNNHMVDAERDRATQAGLHQQGRKNRVRGTCDSYL
jgi:hypothetical protein